DPPFPNYRGGPIQRGRIKRIFYHRQAGKSNQYFVAYRRWLRHKLAEKFLGNTGLQQMEHDRAASVRRYCLEILDTPSVVEEVIDHYLHLLPVLLLNSY
ncbi:hypothetical protein, partial [Roseibium sediminis]|uniref:hypothetical protein n=1 Tax=Roseibium sediminis TaxID=1775174 RepID=UPI00195C4891